MAQNLAETRPRINKPLANCIMNRARGYRLLNELCRVANLRINRQQALDWSTWGYCMAATLFAVEPGRAKRPQIHKGVLLQGVTYVNWPHCEPRQILTVGPLAPFHEMSAVPPEVREDITNAIERAKLSPFRGFMTGDTIARFLSVTREEVETIGLRLINAVGFTSLDRRELRKKKSSLRSEARRRTNGSVPRKEYEEKSLSKLKPWDKLGISRSSFYLKTKQERDDLVRGLIFPASGNDAPDICGGTALHGMDRTGSALDKSKHNTSFIIDISRTHLSNFSAAICSGGGE